MRRRGPIILLYAFSKIYKETTYPSKAIYPSGIIPVPRRTDYVYKSGWVVFQHAFKSQELNQFKTNLAI